MNSERSKLLYRVILSFLALFLIIFLVEAQAENEVMMKDVDAVWSQSDGTRHEIFYSHLSGDTWSEPVMVTDDYYDNKYPVIDRDSESRKWLFWSAYADSTLELRYKIFEKEKWKDTVTLGAKTINNTAPSVIIDAQDVVWLVWAGNDGEIDNIYYSRNQKGDWSEPSPLHALNDTPDILPLIELDDDGIPAVTWQRLQDGNYVTLTSSWENDGWTDPVIAEEVQEGKGDEDQADSVEIPPFINNGALVFFRMY